MTGSSNSLSSSGPSKLGAFQKPPASSVSPSLPLRGPSPRSRSDWASSSSQGRRAKSPPPTRARRCSRVLAKRSPPSKTRRTRRKARIVFPVCCASRCRRPMAHGGSSPLLPAFLARHPFLRIELMMSDRYENLIAEGADVRAAARRAAGLELCRAQAGKREASFRRRPVLPRAAGRAESLADLRSMT